MSKTRKLRSAITAGCLISLVAFSLPTAVAAAKKPFNGNVCGIPSGAELKAADITATCVSMKKATLRPTHTPLGTVSQTHWSARWGTVHFGPSHYLLISVTKASGSPGALAVIRKGVRAKILAHGAPIAVGNPGSLFTDTSSCPNPPTGDCTKAEALALVGNYLVSVGLLDAPPTVPGALEDSASQNNDDAEDEKQEEQVKGPVIAIAKSVAARL